MRLDFKPYPADLVFSTSGFVLLNRSDAISVVPHIPDQVNVDPVWLGFVGWPVWPCHGRGRIERGIGLNTWV